MAIEREPPKPSVLKPKTNPGAFPPQMDVSFGTTSSLRSNLPVHHKPSESVLQPTAANLVTGEGKDIGASLSKHPALILQPASSYDPRIASGNGYNVPSNLGSSYAIPIPLDGPLPKTIPAAPRPTYTVFGPGGFNNIGIPKGASSSNFVDLTVGKWDGTGDDSGFGDAHQYIDSAKANESIKALLQGALEDDDDKPRTRSRKKKSKTSSQEIVGGLSGLTIAKSHKVIEENKNEVPNEEVNGHTDDEEDEHDGTVEGLKFKLLPHQVEGFSWMMDKEIGKRKNGVLPKGGILADDMGLGKTLQSIALILTNPLPPPAPATESEPRKPPAKTEKPTLVVAPLALIKQWEKEIQDKVSSSHQLRVCVHHGPQRTKNFQTLKKYDVVITTYQVLVSEHGSSSAENDSIKAGCFGLNWYRVILDEAHTIKNRNAKASQACYALSAQYRWCLTGTPMQNNLDELQSLIRFLRIKPYNDLSVWREQITGPMKSGRGNMAIKRLQYYLKAFMKRRTKDILKKDGALNTGSKSNTDDGVKFKITERKVEKVVADFSAKERKFYEKLEQRADESIERMMGKKKMSYASALVLLLRLRQACNHPDLVAGKLSKDNDALALLAKRGGSKTGTSGKSKSTQSDDIDDITNMFDGMSVQTKQCDICLTDLSKEEISIGDTKCAGCQEDFSELHDPMSQPSDSTKDQTEDDSDIEILGEAKTQPQDIVSLNCSNEEEEPGQDTGDEDETDTQSLSRGRSAMKKLTMSTKIQRVLKLLRKESDEHKFIVFSQFTSMLDLIEPFLQRDDLQYTRYDGSMKNDLREASLERLRNEPEVRILLCSLKCGSLGLNLTAASRVVILEPFWNPFVEEQAIDRVHRLNQTVDVVVYKITVRGTVEERILELQEKKRELANATIEGKAALKLSMQDILNLFRRDAEYLPDNNALPEGQAWLDEGQSRVMGTLSNEGAAWKRHDQDVGKGSRVPSSGGVRERVVEDSVYGRRW
ncbi:MAG: hypothetical protein M1816_004590 [Peltula sp. TS41687]|nr:MAG: hypothetical protein M1816_004590 [Peltula sp. TS41687]